MKRHLIPLLLIAGVVPAFTQIAPYIYGPTVGTTPTQILRVNPSRKRLIFMNPNAGATVAVCPSGPDRATGQPIVPSIGGAGCFPLLPYGSFTVDGSAPSGPMLFMSSSWNGVASANGSSLSILEFE
jgi:hypothetical protein